MLLRTPRYILLIALSVIVLIGILLYPSFSMTNQIETASSVRIGTTTISVEIADTEELREKGLSGRPSLAESRGMLFLFATADRYAFWMPNMHFPLDIIWIDGTQIVGIDENVPPETNFEHPRMYRPPSPVNRVLEVPAGFAKSHGITIGETISYQLK